MRFTLPPLLASLCSFALATAVHAQLPVVDISLEHDEANAQIKVFLRANDVDFGGVLSNLVYTVRWPDTSPASLGVGSSAWCPPPSQALNLGPSAAVTPGNGFKYRTWTSIGLAAISDLQDDGGCDQVMLADDWTLVHTIAVNGDPGGTEFVIADDAYTADNNRDFYISLNGVPMTGSIFTFSTAAGLGERRLPSSALVPNPASDGIVTANLPGDGGEWNVEIIDASGRSVKSAQGFLWPPRWSVDDVRPGRYLVRISTRGDIFMNPLVIVR